MGFWSSLADIGLTAAAPFTGGASLAGIPLVNGLASATAPGPNGGPSAAAGIGQTAGSIEAARAKGLTDAAKIQQQQDELALQRYNDTLNGQKFAISAPGTLAGQSVRGDVLANAQDATTSGLPSWITSQMGTVSGGLRPSLFSAATRALGGKLSSQALADQTSGKYQSLPVPQATPLPTSTGLDTALQATAGAGGFLNAISGLLKPNSGGGVGNVPGDVTDGNIPDIGAVEGLPDGIDPNILKWFQDQGDGMDLGGG